MNGFQGFNGFGAPQPTMATETQPMPMPMDQPMATETQPAPMTTTTTGTESKRAKRLSKTAIWKLISETQSYQNGSIPADVLAVLKAHIEPKSGGFEKTEIDPNHFVWDLNGAEIARVDHILGVFFLSSDFSKGMTRTKTTHNYISQFVKERDTELRNKQMELVAATSEALNRQDIQTAMNLQNEIQSLIEELNAPSKVKRERATEVLTEKAKSGVLATEAPQLYTNSLGVNKQEVITRLQEAGYTPDPSK